MNFYKYFNIKSALALLALVVFSACHNDNEPEEPVKKNASRTVLVYMVATNNLGTGQFDRDDLDEMLEAAQLGDLNDGRLLAYHASAKGVVLKEIKREGIDTLKVYDNSQSSVSIARMKQVIADMKEMATADDYGLVLWSHATGWLQDGIDDPNAKRAGVAAYSYGADGMTNAKKMNISSLAQAVGKNNFSFIYFDCCYMGSVEVMYEMRDCADYLIASAAEDPAAGMPYHLNMKMFFDKRASAENIAVNSAKSTFDFYNDVFKVGDCPCTMAVVRTDKLDNLAKATKAIYAAADKLYDPAVSYQKFQVGSTCYYFDFGQYIESISTSADLYNNWKKAFNEAVIYAEATPWVWSSFKIEQFSGLSTYILRSESSVNTKAYNTLSWYGDVASALLK